MAIAAQRALLDKLMGPNRNQDAADAVVDDFEDPRVCKFFLLGLCPYTMFKNTKSDLGKCPHEVCNDPQAEKLRRKFEQDPRSKDLGYEVLLMRELEKLMQTLDHRIERGKRRLEETGEGTAQKMDLEGSPEMLELTREIDEKMTQSEKAGEEGNLDESAKLLEEAEALKKKKAGIQAQLLRDVQVPEEFQGNKQLLRVCEVCGAYLSSRDSDERLAEHFAGKVHLGFLKIRSKLEQLRKQLEEKGYDPSRGVLPQPRLRHDSRRPDPRDQGSRSRRDYGRDYGRDGGRDRDYRDNRDRHRSRRDYDGDRSRDYRSSRHDARDRDRDRYSRHSRSGSRHRDHSHSHRSRSRSRSLLR